MQVIHTQTPPRRTEGGGFIIKDILSGLNPKAIDPFLIWHELPRKHYRPGEMPGAPLHPHRGMHECPYNKEMTPDAGSADGGMDMTVRAGGIEKKGKMGVGDFELGKVGVGMEHEALIDPRWSGHLHFFQLWVNLPGAKKMDAPYFQNAGASAIPTATLGEGVSAKVRHSPSPAPSHPHSHPHSPSQGAARRGGRRGLPHHELRGVAVYGRHVRNLRFLLSFNI